MNPNLPSSEPSLVDALVQLSFTVQAVLLRIADAHGVTPVQMRLLGILRDHEPEMLALAKYMKLDKSSITGLVDRAEKRGLVQRMPVPEDKRMFRVAATPLGRQLTAEVAAQVEAEILKLAEKLSDDDRQQFIRLASLILAG